MKKEISKDEKMDALGTVIADVRLPVKDRVKAYEEQRKMLLNPFPVFDPATFDPYADTPDYDLKKRPRVEPPRILPDMGMLPKEIMEGQMIGMFESKQDLYLLVAWLSRRLSAAEDIIQQLQGRKKMS